MVKERENKYIPALRFQFLTPLYDPLLAWVMRERTFKLRLIQEARISPGSKVLDLGCGTGTLTLLIKQLHPDAQVIGIDGDSQVLTIARRKASQSGINLTFDQGMAYRLPYPESSFDRVLSSLVMHHLTREDRRLALREILRVLKPGSGLLIIDFGKPHNPFAWAISLFMRRWEKAADLIDGMLSEELVQAGFQNVRIVARFMTVFGTIALYSGQKYAAG